MGRGSRVHGALVDQGHEFDDMDRRNRRRVAPPAGIIVGDRLGEVGAAPRALPFSDDLMLTPRIVTSRIACLGGSGSGKTYAAGRLTECLLDAGAQVVVIDNVGNWYGLRVAADGRGRGIAIPILGGEHGDAPLAPSDGRLVAEAVAETRSSMIVDVSDFDPDDVLRFARDFATHLLAAKKRQRSPVLVIWEEVHEIVPERVIGKDAARTVAAVARLVKRGRNYGAGTLLISQRTAAVNKDVLNLAGTLLAFRTGGPQDRAALRKWIDAQDTELALAQDLADLPRLPDGTCVLWSPHDLGVTARIRVSKKRTYDASKTPELDEAIVAAGELAPVDLERFTAKLGAAMERAREDDPEHLRQQIRTLRVTVTDLQRELARPRPVERVVERVEVLDMDTVNALRAATARIHETAGEAHDRISKLLEEHRKRATASAPAPAPTRSKPAPAPATKHVAGPDVFSNPIKLEPSHQKILAAIAWFSTVLGVDRPSKTAVSKIAGYKTSGGRYGNLLGSLRSAGLIEYPGGDTVALTAGGWSTQPPPETLTAAEVYREVRAVLEPSHLKLLDEMLKVYPHAISVAELAQRTGYDPDGGRYGNLRGHLVSLYIAEYPVRNQIRASPNLRG